MPDMQKFLSDIASDSADVRFAAWRSAGEMDGEAVLPLAKLAGSEKPGVAKAAREAIYTLVHAVGKDPGAAKRAGVVKALLAVAGGSYAGTVRAHAFRQLSLLAGEDSVPAVARWLGDAALREEAVFCLERIPGPTASKAMLAAYRTVAPEFRPRILAALGHRRVEEAAALCAEAMRSPDSELAMAAAKAFGRIGRRTAGPPRFPDGPGLSPWQRIEQVDATLRFADAQREQGHAAEALRLYGSALDRPEEHWQCAAIIGIARIGTPEAAAAIFPKLKSGNSKVRITARNAWRGMAPA